MVSRADLLPVSLQRKSETGVFETFTRGGPTFRNYLRFLFYAGEPRERAFDTVQNFTDGINLQLVFFFDSYPEEVSVDIHSSNNTVYFYRPPRYYIDKRRLKVREAVRLPSIPDNYTLTVHDARGDGLARKGKATGYTLTYGREVLAVSGFLSGFEEQFEFALSVTSSDTEPEKSVAPVEPIPLADAPASPVSPESQSVSPTVIAGYSPDKRPTVDPANGSKTGSPQQDLKASSQETMIESEFSLLLLPFLLV